MSARIAREMAPPNRGLAYQARVVKVFAATAFKLKYANSVLGYFWSFARPLALFATLYVVFGRALRVGAGTEHYPVFLLIGVVLFFFVADATTTTMTSIVTQRQLLRKIAFPRLVIPVSASLTSFITFSINLAAIGVFLAWNRIAPELDWLLLFLLFLELYVFVLGISLVLATLYARLRDVATIWELVLRVGFYALGIIYPLQVLPVWAQRVALTNPFTQVMQDARAIVLGDAGTVSASEAFAGAIGHAIPLAVAAATFLLGLIVFRRRERFFAEQV